MSDNTSGFVSESRPSSSDSQISKSFQSLVENYTKPYISSYDQFATSYIVYDPFITSKLNYDEVSNDSESIIEIPFKEPVQNVEIFEREKMRHEFGPSLRKKGIIPSSTLIYNQINKFSQDHKNKYEINKNLYEKSKQWCEIQKALVLDSKFPKPDVNLIRNKYSQAHQISMESARNKLGLKDSDPIFEQKYATFGENYPDFGKSDSDHETEMEEGDTNGKLEEKVKEIFGEIPRDKLDTHNWQSEAEKSLQIQPKPKKIRYWKKNVYPKRTKEEIIREMRLKRYKPPKPEHLEVDYLSEIWDKELMVQDFQITGVDYDGTLDLANINNGWVNWHKMQESREKCLNWLKFIPDNL